MLPMADKRFRLTKDEKQEKAISDRRKEEIIPVEEIQALFDY